MEYERVDDLKRIKKDYGENMAHLCRSLFPTILEDQGALYHILSTHFDKSRFLYDDIVKEHKEYIFKEYLYHFYDSNKEADQVGTKSVEELLDEAGYRLFQCHDNDDVQLFKKYYAPGEELCTFRDPNRIHNYHIFFIVKKNINEIKRENFTQPEREDEYGVSVLDLQFDKGNKQRVSIKSRYNHSVYNPDATYSNNLDSIAPGLTEAFERDFGFNIGKEYEIGFELDHYVKASDGKFYKYNYEIFNIHYCPNNIIIDNGQIVDTYSDKSRYTFMDYFILDEKEKRLIIYDQRIKDSFIDGLQDITNISIANEGSFKTIELKLSDENNAIIKLDKQNRIIGYDNGILKQCENNFLENNEILKELNLPSLQTCGNNFLYCNMELEYIDLPLLQKCGNDFLSRNNKIKKLNLPALEECCHSFLCDNESLAELNLPLLRKCGDCFLARNQSLDSINLPLLDTCGNDFISQNIIIKDVNLPSLQWCGSAFLYQNLSLEELSLPSLKKCGYGFIAGNQSINEVDLPALTQCGSQFLHFNECLVSLNLPSLERCGSDFLMMNVELIKIDLPLLKECRDGFLSNNLSLEEINLPSLQKHGKLFLTFVDEGLINLPSLIDDEKYNELEKINDTGGSRT